MCERYTCQMWPVGPRCKKKTEPPGRTRTTSHQHKQVGHSDSSGAHLALRCVQEHEPNTLTEQCCIFCSVLMDSLKDPVWGFVGVCWSRAFRTSRSGSLRAVWVWREGRQVNLLSTRLVFGCPPHRKTPPAFRPSNRCRRSLCRDRRWRS